MSDYITVASTGDIQPGQGKCVEAGENQIALFNVDGSFYAIDNNCPHALGPLAEGDLEGKVVSCPLHGWPFDVTTGECSFNPSANVKTFPVRIEGDQVQVSVSG